MRFAALIFICPLMLAGCYMADQSTLYSSGENYQCPADLLSRTDKHLGESDALLKRVEELWLKQSPKK